MKSRAITVKGPRGELKRNFRHLALDFHKEGDKIVVESWFGSRRKNAQVKTVCTHIENMIEGVTKGFRYKMRFVYAHFPVNVNISPDNTTIEIRNFLGEKVVRRVTMLEGCKVSHTGQKDEIQVEGNDLEKVSLSASHIHMSVKVKDKDIRKFLDGIYVSEKTNIKA